MSSFTGPIKSLFLAARLVRGARVRWAALHWLTAGAVLALVGATWRLWTPQAVFPQVPLLAVGLWMPAWMQWLAAMVLVASPLVAALCVRHERTRRAALAGFVVSAAVLVAADQLRLQPWVYEFALIASVLALAPPSRALGLCRVLLIGIYLHSAWTKFDYSFLHELGPRLVAPLDVPNAWQWLAAAALPLGEALVAFGLLLPKTRTPALLASVAMHVTLLALLGPWLLDHSLGVLVWNVFFIAQNVLLFWPVRRASHRKSRTVSLSSRSKTSGFGTATVAAALLLPLAEPWGGWDLWPSWGLYASRAERTIVWIRTTDETHLPAELGEHLATAADSSGWRQVDLPAWSLASLGVPLYPQNRYQFGVASRIAWVTKDRAEIRVRLVGRANRWTGVRESEDLASIPEIQRRQAKFLLSAAHAANWPRLPDAP
jgi:hypothetical protein